MTPELNTFMARVTELGLRPGDIARDDTRPIADYPQMPRGTCHLSARYLAEIYPELRAVTGILVFVYGGVDYKLDHSWCVRDDGQIVDPTWHTESWAASDVTYWPANEGGAS